MARPLRIEYPGAVYHVTSRGNGREPIFLADTDRHLFLNVLGEVVEESRWLCHAYCLMTNHYHLLVETPDANISAGMRQLNGLYTQRFNRRHEHVGHVFQGRFKGILVERESHLLELARYVVLNPVRAEMVQAPEDYRWSSLRATLGLAPPPPWLTVGALLESFGSPARYGDFVLQGIGESAPWDELQGALLGSEGFARRVGRHLEEKATEREIPRRERLAHRKTLEELFPHRVVGDRALRNETIREARRRWGYCVADIARHLGLHYASVSRIASLRGQVNVEKQDLTPSGGVGV